jgi:hypothetical protein
MLPRILALFCIALFIFSTGSSLVSCSKKKEILRDTVYLKDTIIKKDTIKIVDSINCNCYDLKDGLVAYYNFNGGNLNDSSGYGNHIILNNAVKCPDRYGRPNNAYQFNGSNQFMKVANSASLNVNGAITMMATVKMNGFYSGVCKANQIFQKGIIDQENGVYGLRIADISTSCYVALDTAKESAYGFYGDYNSSIQVRDTSKYVNSNTWINLIYTYDGHEARLYVNGALKNVVKATASFNANTYGLFIGRAESDIYPYWWNGVIDEIRIYKKALCEGAVHQLASQSN